MNLNCNLQTIEAKTATTIDVGGSEKKNIDTCSLTLVIVHLIFLENCQGNMFL